MEETAENFTNEDPLTLEKDRSRIRLSGGVFEFQLAGLAAARLRALRRRSPQLRMRFRIATNVRGAHPFDDVVLHLRWSEGPSPSQQHSLTYFVQCKHKENVNLPVSAKDLTGKLTARSKDFNLRHYYDAFKATAGRAATETSTQEFVRQCLSGDFRLILLTTRKVLHHKGSDTSAPPFEEILYTGRGEAFSWSKDDREVWDMLAGTPEEDDFRSHFLARLRVLSAQAQVSALDAQLLPALVDAVGGRAPRPERLLGSYNAFLHSWWNDDAGVCLSEDSFELEKIVREDVHRELPLLDFQQYHSDALAARLEGSEAALAVVAGIPSTLRPAAILRVLQRAHSDRFVVLTDASFKEYDRETLLSLCCKECDEMVVSCDAVNEDVRCFVGTLLSEVGCRVRILVAEWERNVWEWLRVRVKMCGAWTERWALDQLSTEEQRRLLETSVSFQGHDISLAALEKAWPTLRRGVRGTALGALVDGRPVALGCPLPPLHDLYVPRTLRHSSVLSEDVFCMRSASDFFLLSGFPKNILDRLRLPDSPWMEFLDRGLVSAKEEDTSCISQPSKTKWCEDDGNGSDFASGCENVHWLTYDKGVVVWTRSVGERRRVQEYVRKMSLSCQNELVCLHNEASSLLDWKDSTLFVCDNAGTGKSTFITRVAHALKNEMKSRWVIVVRINEGKRGQRLRDEIELNHIVNVLKHCCSSRPSPGAVMEKPFLRDCLLRSGQIAVLVDGVDEVCPAHKDSALRFLEVLQSALEKSGGCLWVTARTVLEQDIARTLRCAVPLSLLPFSSSDQQRYLVQRWRSEMDWDVQDLEERVGALVDALREATACGQRSLCDVPLYTRMLADTHRERDLELLLMQRSSSEVASHINRLSLYKRLVTKTLEVVWDKMGVSENDRVMLSNSHRGVLEKHGQYAALECFSDCKLLGTHYDDLVSSVNKLSADFEKEKTSRSGIVTKVVDGKPVFIHYTIAEYLAALWLWDKYSSLPQLLKELYSGQFGEVRFFLDALLAEGRPLHEAALDGRPESVEAALLRKGQDLDAVDEGGRQALHLAAIGGHQSAVRALLKEGARADARDSVMGWTPLRYADAMIGSRRNAPCGAYPKDTINHMGVADELLGANADPYDAPHIFKDTRSLSYAFEFDYSNIAKRIIKKGAPLFIQRRKPYQYMHEAAKLDSVNILSMLSLLGFSVNRVDERGVTPLHVAVCFGQERACTVLLGLGARVADRCLGERTALHLAAEGGRDALCRALLAAGADADAEDADGRTPLCRTTLEGGAATRDALVDAGAQLQATDCDDSLKRRQWCGGRTERSVTSHRIVRPVEVGRASRRNTAISSWGGCCWSAPRT